MAANQTIIQAAGQRYAPTKIDYSGYIQGISSVAKALIEKKKLLSKKQAEIDKLMDGAETDITPWYNIIKDYVDDETIPPETKASTVKKLKEGTLKLEENQSKLGTLVDPKGPGLSNSVDAITANYLYSYANGDFDQSFYVTQPVYNEDDVQIGTKQVEFNMNMAPDPRPGKNFSPLVVGPEGLPIDMNEFENLLNVASSTDGNEIVELLEGFQNLKEVKKDKNGIPPIDDLFNGARNQTLGKIKRIFKEGTKDNVGNFVSGKNAMASFMFDSEVILPGDNGTQTFVKWYLNKPGLIPDELQEMYNETFRGDEEKGIIGKFEQLSGEEEKAMLNMLAQDLIKYDPNIEEDLMTYINSIFELNR